MNYELREMLPGDEKRILEIFQQGIDSGIATFETQVPTAEVWNMEFFNDCRWVLENENNEVVGWCGLKLISKRDCYKGVAEVSIYLDNKYQGLGLGSILLKKMVLDSENHGFWTLQASIFSENEASIKFHHKNGFRTVGIRKKIAKLNGVWKDVILLEKRSEIIS
ncbi:phosphinothricin acetyltransferase [Chryseobacterium soldanellicola]|uniref:Phosphinothricin acetyltransferase n=1 Tax=Chryseobacterium soldanellicola TaxID=311333 RepID=A0A1H1G5W7_9FLAO|nr:GNAT family N-acetyltransferase [Chryseobacterium soldanellicola]SDR08627.1 phosphinothricin acetyltransferase [Chryseobacterium soldanellicola]